MKLSLLTAATLAALTGVASAEGDVITTTPTNHYVDAGAEFGWIRAMAAGVHIGGGYRLGHSNYFAHAQLTAGHSGNEGDYQQVRAGVEARSCTWFDRFCVFAGVDVGYQHDHVVDEPSIIFSLANSDDDPYVATAHDLIAVPRFGFEIGAPIKLRTAIEMPMYRAIAGDTPMANGKDMRSGVNGMISMSLVYSF
jgi:hypothetical protein